MDEIINAFGIDVRLIIIQIVNFAILMAALGYFLYRPVLKLLREREEKISQGLKDAELAALARAEADAERQVILTGAHADAAAVATRAKSAADVTASEVLAVAEGKAAELLKQAELRSEQLRAQALAESDKEIAQLAMLATEKLLRAPTK